MPLLLSILALVVAACAILVAWRAARAAHRLALEMVHLRDRLAAAEAHYDRASHQTTRAGRQATPDDGSFAPRLAALEERVHAARRPSPPEVVARPDEDAVERIRRLLLRDGYEHVTVLETLPDGRVLVEAEREGVTSKGRVALDDEGALDWQPVSSLRAFP